MQFCPSVVVLVYLNLFCSAQDTQKVLSSVFWLLSPVHGDGLDLSVLGPLPDHGDGLDLSVLGPLPDHGGGLDLSVLCPVPRTQGWS